jgi:maltose-binding protein MalE
MPSAIQSGTRSGKLYGLPNALHPDYAGVIINKTMFQKEGVPIPKEEWTDGPHPGWKSWTFDDLKSAAIALTQRANGRTTQWGFQMQGAVNSHDVTREAMRSEGMDAVSADGSKIQYATDVGRKVLGFYADLYINQKVAPLTADMPQGGPDLMASGRVAMRHAPVWAIQTALQTFKDFEWQIIPARRGRRRRQRRSELLCGDEGDEEPGRGVRHARRNHRSEVGLEVGRGRGPTRKPEGVLGIGFEAGERPQLRGLRPHDEYRFSRRHPEERP